jgi:cell division transport system permease protein
VIRLVHIFRELFRNLSRYPITALASVLSMSLLFLLFDLFWVAAGTSGRFYRDLLSELQVEVFLDEAVADTSRPQYEEEIRAIPGVSAVQFVSREAARQRLAGLVGTDLLAGYDESNPLPRSFVLAIDEASLNTADLERIEGRLFAIDGVSDVSYSRAWLEKAEGTRAVMLEIGLVLGGLILATAIVSSANNIRLMTRARAVGFRQMLYMGAGRLFVAMPFVIEGFLISAVSAVLGWLIIWYGSTRVTFTQLVVVYPSREEIAIFCLVVALLGAISGYVGLRRVLRD